MESNNLCKKERKISKRNKRTEKTDKENSKINPLSPLEKEDFSFSRSVKLYLIIPDFTQFVTVREFSFIFLKA
jgi:hypothetical protein